MDVNPESAKQVCRTCLTQVTDFVVLDSDPKSIQIKLELSFCIPEMNFSLLKDSVLCLQCVNSLRTSYQFRKQCLYVEECIKNCINNKNVSGDLSLTEIFKNSSGFKLKPTAVGLRNSEAPRAVLESTSHDIVDELNSLLDDALGFELKAPHLPKTNHGSNGNCNENKSVKMETKLEEEEMEIGKCLWSNRDNESSQLVLELNSNQNVRNDTKSFQYNGTHLTECFVKLDKLSFNEIYSLLKCSSKDISCSAEKQFACKMCKFYTAKKKYLTRHIKRHKKLKNFHGKKVFACHLCAYSALQRCNLARHMRVHTKSLAPMQGIFQDSNKQKKFVKTSKVATTFSCHICKYKTKLSTSFMHHTRLHTSTRQFSCSECGFLALSQCLLKRHLVVHSKEKPFACDTCDFCTAHKDSLAKHKKIHDNF